MFAYVELNDHDDENRRVLSPISGHGLVFEEVSEGRVIISAPPQKDRVIKAPSYEAIRVAMFAAGMVLDCTVAEDDLTASLLSDGEAKTAFVPTASALTELEFAQATITGLKIALNARDAELAAAKEASAEMVAVKSHLLRMAMAEERFCHLTPADAVSELMRLWEGQRTLIRQMQSDARMASNSIDSLLARIKAADMTILRYADETAALRIEIGSLKQDLAYEREQRFGKTAVRES